MHNYPEIPLIINFTVLAGALVFLTRKPLRNYMSSRSEVIQKNVEESERLQQEALAMLKDYEGRLSKLDGEIRNMMDDARKAGEKEKDEILIRAEKMSAQIIENAKNMATQELAKQKDKLQRELMTKVIAEALANLKSKASEKDHQQFMTQFISQMEKHGDVN